MGKHSVCYYYLTSLSSVILNTNSSFLAILKTQSALLLLDSASSALKNSSISLLEGEGDGGKDISHQELTAVGRLFENGRRERRLLLLGLGSRGQCAEELMAPTGSLSSVASDKGNSGRGPGSRWLPAPALSAPASPPGPAGLCR